MPDAAEILAGLTRVATTFWYVAVGWHVVVALVASALLSRRWRPDARWVAAACALPLASVAILAGLTGNPFNAIVIGATALALGVTGARAPEGSLSSTRRPVFVAGVLTLAFAWVYPHFLEGQPTWLYIVAAPMGLVPCPSLALVLGVGLCAGGFSSRAWSVIAGAVGIFYGLFGALRLGVWLDLPLVAAAVLTLLTARRPTAST